jgi:hypothetical protein
MVTSEFDSRSEKPTAIGDIGLNRQLTTRCPLTNDRLWVPRVKGERLSIVVRKKSSFDPE